MQITEQQYEVYAAIVQTEVPFEQFIKGIDDATFDEGGTEQDAEYIAQDVIAKVGARELGERILNNEAAYKRCKGSDKVFFKLREPGDWEEHTEETDRLMHLIASEKPDVEIFFTYEDEHGNASTEWACYEIMNMERVEQVKQEIEVVVKREFKKLIDEPRKADYWQGLVNFYRCNAVACEIEFEFLFRWQGESVTVQMGNRYSNKYFGEMGYRTSPKLLDEVAKDWAFTIYAGLA